MKYSAAVMVDVALLIEALMMTAALPLVVLGDNATPLVVGKIGGTITVGPVVTKVSIPPKPAVLLLRSIRFPS
jgi:hypothetical protein